jgi:hypothetical protein
MATGKGGFIADRRLRHERYVFTARRAQNTVYDRKSGGTSRNAERDGKHLTSKVTGRDKHLMT